MVLLKAYPLLACQRVSRRGCDGYGTCAPPGSNLVLKTARYGKFNILFAGVPIRDALIITGGLLSEVLPALHNGAHLRGPPDLRR